MSAKLDALKEVNVLDWKPVTLGSIVRIVTYGISAASLAELSEVQHYSLPAFDAGAGPEIGPGEAIKSNKTVVPHDCVLFSKLNPRIPRIWRIKGSARPHSYCSTEFWPLVAEANDVDLDYLTQYLSSAAFLGHPDITPSSSTNSHQRVDRKAFEKFRFLIPPLDEQRQIVEVLRSVDDAIAAEREYETQAKAVRAALLHEHFHMGDWAEEGLPLPDGWQLTLLDGVALRGSGHTPNKKIAEYWDGGIRWVSLQDTKRLDQVYISETEQEISALGIASSSAVLHPDGIVVISRDATVGRSAITVGQMAVSQHFIAYRCGPTLDKHYLYYWFQRMKPVFERIGAGSTIKTIGLPFFKSLRIALPPLGLQKEMAAAMLDVDQSIVASRKAITSLSALKAALMSDLLSGRVRVPATTVSNTKPVPSAFKRAVFAAEIVHQLHNDNRFGSVKHEKIVHLCELHLGLQADLDRHAYKEAAGPYDPKARRSVERIFQQQKWFDVTKPAGSRVVYVPLEKAGRHAEYFDRYFGNQKSAIQWIIDLMRPLDTSQCEIVATLYAVWNDFLLDGLQPSDDEIVKAVLQWHPKKQDIAEDRWLAALPWMRQKGLIPKGIGEKTRVAQG